MPETVTILCSGTLLASRGIVILATTGTMYCALPAEFGRAMRYPATPDAAIKNIAATARATADTCNEDRYETDCSSSAIPEAGDRWPLERSDGGNVMRSRPSRACDCRPTALGTLVERTLGIVQVKEAQ